MMKKSLKKSSQTAFLRYAVIGALLLALGGQGVSLAADEQGVLADQEDIRSVDDPFNIRMRVPDLFEFFMKGLEQIKNQMEAAKKPDKPLPPPPEKKPAPPPVIAPVQAVPVQRVVPKPQCVIPVLTVTGIVYDTPLPQAIVNGRVVRTGDVVDGAKIVRIEKGLVGARFEDQDIIVKFNNK